MEIYFYIQVQIVGMPQTLHDSVLFKPLGIFTCLPVFWVYCTRNLTRFTYLAFILDLTSYIFFHIYYLSLDFSLEMMTSAISNLF